MTSNEFHKRMQEAAKIEDAKAVEMICQKFITELSVDISKMISNKCTALTGGLVAEMLRRYAAEICCGGRRKHGDRRENAIYGNFRWCKAECIPYGSSAWSRRRKMTNVQKEKHVFVRSELSRLLIRCDRTISEVDYIVLEDGSEIVKVIWENGYYKSIDVTCDSLMQIAKDVMKEIRV